MPTVVATAMIVFLAELGDKTQIVCLGLVARFGARRVLFGALVAAVLNTGLAVLLGQGFSLVLPMALLQLLASLGFIGFGLWSLWSTSSETSCPEVAPSTRLPLWSIFLAFFLAELGDKTQLVTLGLSTKQPDALLTWGGAAVGLFAAQALAILASKKIAARLTPQVLKYGAALIFVVFGIIGIRDHIPGSPFGTWMVFAMVALIFVLSWHRSPRTASHEVDERRDRD